MWYKKEDIGFYIWVPEEYKFFDSFGIFSDIKYDQHILDKLKELSEKSTIILYENYLQRDDAAINNLENIFKDINIIIAISFFKNRYSKPFTGGFEYIIDIANKINSNFEFKPELSIMVSNKIGLDLKSLQLLNIIKGDYIDRAFAHNIGIKTVIPPSMFFENKIEKISWSWPKSVLPLINRDKLFYEKEPQFKDFIFANIKNIIFIVGPPFSGKTVLSRRINKILECKIIDKQTPFEINEYDIKNELDNTISIIFICCAATMKEKQKIIEIFEQFKIIKKPINAVWINMITHKQIITFMRYFKVQIAKTTNIILESNERINKYYANIRKENYSEIEIPKYITQINFPLVLKKMPELMYIF